MKLKKRPITDIRFNFKNEVEQAYRDFPQLREATAFADFSDPSFTIIHPELRLTLAERCKERIKKAGSCAAYVTGVTSGRDFRLVVFNPSRYLETSGTDIDKYKTLDHEIGHCLLPEGDSENAADAFAAIRSLQRFGSADYIAVYSAVRSYNLMKWGDLKHLSSPLLNQIAEDSRNIDFKSLSPDETIEKAREYAAKFTPSEDDIYVFNGMPLSSLCLLFNKKMSIKYLARKAFRKRSPLATEVGASLIRPFLTPEGADFMGKRVKFSPREQAKLQKRLQKSLARLA